MKRINVVVVLFLMLGWSGCRENSGTVDIVTVDISQNYPKKDWCSGFYGCGIHSVGNE